MEHLPFKIALITIFLFAPVWSAYAPCAPSPSPSSPPASPPNPDYCGTEEPGPSSPPASPPNPDYCGTEEPGTSSPPASPPNPDYCGTEEPSPSSPPNPDYCSNYCGTEDAICDTNTGNCICEPGILKLPQPIVPFRRRSLLWHCKDDDICKKYWCHSQDSYCDDGACICHPCGPN